MKRFKLTKGIQLILISLLILVIGAIIVGITSNNKASAATRACGDSNCPGTATARNYTTGTHRWHCNVCSYIASESCSGGAWYHKSGTSVHQKFCWACGYFYTQANCSDSDGDGSCDSGCGNDDMHTHSYSSTSYEQNNSSTHSIIKICSCGATTSGGTESHSLGSWSSDGSSGHSASCSKCGYEKTESHNSNVTIDAVAATCTTAGKSLVKANPSEKVGVFCLKNGKPSVVEYTEISEEMSNRVDENGNLVFGESHINCNMFNIKGIEKIGAEKLPYHIAFKKAPYMNENAEIVKPIEPNAYKFESFIFDAFEKLDNMTILRVKREEEFAPVKNAEGTDSPETAIKLYNAYHSHE